MAKREKSRKTLTTTKNRFHPLSESSDSEIDDDLGRIVKRKRKATKSREDKSAENASNKPEETIESILENNKATNSTKPQSTQNKSTSAPKPKNHMPPIIIDGKTSSQNTLVNDIKKNSHWLIQKQTHKQLYDTICRGKERPHQNDKQHQIRKSPLLHIQKQGGEDACICDKGFVQRHSN